MKITSYKTSLRTIKPNDPRFMIQDTYVMAPRAGFHILQECPREYKLVIQECIQRGWLQPVANMTERELLFIGLSQE